MHIQQKTITFASMKKAIVIGASSGIGRKVARMLICEGWSTGLAARRIDRLQQLKEQLIATTGDAQRIETMTIDVCDEDAPDKLLKLIETIGGIDLYVHAAGVGWQNTSLDPDKESTTVETNAVGFTRMVDTTFNFMSQNGGGHIAVISSIAGTKGLGAAPSYSATKAFQNKYIEALEQLSATRKLNIMFTDIRPGFVATDLINGGEGYPLLMNKEKVAAAIVKAIKRHRRVVVVDWRWSTITALWRLIPRWLWRRMKVEKQ